MTGYKKNYLYHWLSLPLMDNIKLYFELCDASYQNWKDVVSPMLLQAQTFWKSKLQQTVS